MMYSLVESAKLCGIDPHAYLLHLADVAIETPGTVVLPESQAASGFEAGSGKMSTIRSPRQCLLKATEVVLYMSAAPRQFDHLFRPRLFGAESWVLYLVSPPRRCLGALASTSFLSRRRCHS